MYLNLSYFQFKKRFNGFEGYCASIGTYKRQHTQRISKLAMHNHGLLIILRRNVSRVKLMLLAKFALPRVIFSFSLSLPFSVRNTWVVKKFPTQLLRVRKPMRSVCRYFPHVVSRLMDPPWRRVSHGPWSKRFVFVFRSRWLRLCDEARRAP